MNQKRLKQIEIENKIWLLYLILIGLSFYANSLEKDYFITKNETSKIKYRMTNITIFTALLFVYAYFEKDAIESFFTKEKSITRQTYDTLILVASTAILISGFIFLYILLQDKNIEEEIAFS